MTSYQDFYDFWGSLYIINGFILYIQEKFKSSEDWEERNLLEIDLPQSESFLGVIYKGGLSLIKSDMKCKFRRKGIGSRETGKVRGLCRAEESREVCASNKYCVELKQVDICKQWKNDWHGIGRQLIGLCANKKRAQTYKIN